MLREAEIHNQFAAFLNKIGLPFDHSRTDKRTSTKIGMPDFAIYSGGRVLFVEVKIPGGKLSPDQRKRKAELEAAGCPVAICYSLLECVYAVTTWRNQKILG